ncbi:unnamed protein product [Sphagnum jensenii]|uniref:Mediator of RNA polymerase II transcription subunit 16 n=1 Tax=Sphagnum jensenii TaxID=128206 RepID=A0ABP0XHP7_9BRYO
MSSTNVVGPVGPLPLSVSTANFPGTPAVRLIGDCHFLHRLCQLLLFCLIFQKRQLLRFVGGVAGRTGETVNKVGPVKEEAMAGVRSSPATVVKVEDGGQIVNRSTGTITKGSDEVKNLFLVLVDLCKKTAQLPHPLPKSQVGNNTPTPQLHFIDGQFNVAPEVVEASLGPHMQNLPRPRGADTAGLLMRELELHPPSEEWNRRTLSAVGLGSFSNLLGSRHDVITSVWKAAQHGIWHKCLRCGRQTSSSSTASNVAVPSPTVREMWAGRWAFGCPMCGG